MATRRLGCLLRHLNHLSPHPTSADAPAVGDEGGGGAVLSEADLRGLDHFSEEQLADIESARQRIVDEQSNARDPTLAELDDVTLERMRALGYIE